MNNQPTLEQLVKAMAESVAPHLRKKREPEPTKQSEKSTHNGTTQAALKMIKERPGITTTQLAEALGVDRNLTMVKTLARQRQAGKITSERLPLDTKWFPAIDAEL